MNSDTSGGHGDEVDGELVDSIVEAILQLEKINVSKPKPHGLPVKICAIAEEIVG